MSFFTSLFSCFRKPKPPVVPPAPPTFPVVQIVIVDHGTGTTGLAAAAAAFNKALIDFSKPQPAGWGTMANVRAAANEKDIQPGEWIVGLFRDPDAPGALGYHDLSPLDTPYSKVFPLLGAQYGANWTTTASHEIFEMLADPVIMLISEAVDGQLWAVEVCDAVETVEVMIDGVPVSDWVTPAYFNLPPGLTLPLDWAKKVHHPLEILPGGYGQYLDPSKGWVQVLGRGGKSLYRQHADGRTARRQGKFLKLP